MNNSNQTKLWTLGLLAALTLAGCSDKQDAQEDASDVTAQPTTPSVLSAPGSLDVPAQALANSPLESLDFAARSAKSAFADQAGLRLSDELAVKCSDSGLPISPIDSRNTAEDDKSHQKVLPESDKAFVYGRFICFLNHDTESSESVAGTFGEARMLACIVSAIPETERYDGQPHTITVDVASSLCMSDKIKRESRVPSVNLTVTGHIPAAFGGAGWDKSIEAVLAVPGESATMTTKILEKRSATEVGYAVVGGGTPNDVFSVYVNPSQGILTYEAKFQRLNWAGWASHPRMIVEGIMSIDGVFTGVKKLSGIFAQAQGPANGSSAVTSAALFTIQGAFEEGVKSRGYRCNSEAACAEASLWYELEGSGECRGDCSNNEGLVLNNNDDLEPVMNEAVNGGTQPVSEWIEALPLTFTDIR